MIIIGDIAVPTEQHAKIVGDFINQVFPKKNEVLLFNLEGLITDKQPLNENSPILFNHSSILESVDGFKHVVTALANNHTLDLPQYLESSKNQLKNKNILSVGAGNELDSDFKMVCIEDNGYQVFIINACWDFLLYHQNNKNSKQKVNIINEIEILTLVKKLKLEKPNSKIVVYFHWSFDLEILPSPSYRIFSQDLINAGVSLVVGCHAHCVQGGEQYKDGYIIYGLGNFYIPSGIYANGKLKFPAMSDLGWGINWDIKTNTIKNYWIDTSNNQLALKLTDNFESSSVLKEYSEYSNLSEKDYIGYFKKNRRKKKLNPVFYNYKDKRINWFKMNLLKTRAKFARLLAKMNLINWQN